MARALRTFLAAAVLLLAAALLGPAAPKPLALPEEEVAVAVKAAPIARFSPRSDAVRFGSLDFRGGLVLSSAFPGFGGISAFTLARDGRTFLAVTDAGVLLRGTLDSDGDDAPTGLSDVRARALRDDAGRLQALNGRNDSESLALAPDAVYVGFETVNEIWRYPADPFGNKGTRVAVPEGVTALRTNLGLESLADVPSGPLAGALLAVGEEGATAGADLPGFIIGGQSPGTFTIRKSGPFDATDMALGPRGEVYLLERHYSPATGVALQIRRFPLAEVAPGAVIAGEVLGTFDMGYEIDNMEGLAVTENAAGETLLTLVSDDNFSPAQRTILLRFAVLAD